MAEELNLKPLQASPYAWRNVQQSVKADAFGNPTELTLRFSNGKDVTLTDPDDILANIMGSSRGERFRQGGKYALDRWVRGPHEASRSFAHQLGKDARELLSKDNPIHNFLKKGPLAAGAASAGLGLLANGILTSIGAQPIGGNNWLLPTATGLLGAGIGHISSSAEENEKIKDQILNGTVEKSAAMYKDPRNFILEKLIADKDISLALKASLAESVRRMDIADAKELAADVRASVGFGVGKLVAEYFATESAFNGFGDTLAPTILNSLAERVLNNQ